MKIYVLANTILFKSSISGGDVVVPQLAKRWRGKYDLEVITTEEGRSVWESLGAEATFRLLSKIFIDRSDSILLGPIKYLIRTLQAIRLAGKLFAKEEGQFLIYTPGDFLPDTLPAAIARVRFQNSRWVSWVYHIIRPPWERKGNFLFSLFSYLLQRSGLVLVKRKADLILVLGGTYKDLIDLGFPKKKLQMSNAGVDTETIKKVKPVEKKYDAVHVGTLTFTKGVYDLLEIWKLVIQKKRKAKLAIVGGGSKSLIEDYKEKIKNMGLGKNVDYHGFVPKNEDVYAIMKASTLYLCPGHENGWSLPVAEAMTAGIPTVAYNLKMFGGAFKKGFVMVPMYAKKKFAEKVVELLNDEEKRKELARQALAESKNFDWQNIADNIGQIIDGL